MNSDISDVLIEQCPTKVLLANTEAENEGSREFYEKLGLNAREITNIAHMKPKMHYFITSPVGRRTISLGLGGVALSFTGVSSVEHRNKFKQMMATFGKGCVEEWLRWRAVSTKNKALVGWADFFHKNQLLEEKEGK
jgi:type IV secretion system protein VirB4